MGQCLSRSKTPPLVDATDPIPAPAEQQPTTGRTFPIIGRDRIWSVASTSQSATVTPDLKHLERETTLTNTTATLTTTTRTVGSGTASSLYFERSIDEVVCSCEDLLFTADLDFVAFPSLWTSDHDDALHEILSDLNLQDLFEIFRDLLIENTVHHDDPNVLFTKRRSRFPLSSFCQSWYQNFATDKFRIMQLGTCGGRTRFALNFAGDQMRSLHGTDRRYVHSIDIDDLKVPIEILDTNIGEYPSMTRTYLETFDPHVLIFFFDVCDIDSWISLQRSHQHLRNIYESIDDVFGGTPNPNNNTNPQPQLSLQRDVANNSNHSRQNSNSNGFSFLPNSLRDNQRRESTTVTLSHDLPRHSFGAPPQLVGEVDKKMATAVTAGTPQTKPRGWSVSNVLGITHALYHGQIHQTKGSMQFSHTGSSTPLWRHRREGSRSVTASRVDEKKENIYHSSSMSTRIFSQMPPIILVGLHNHKKIRSDDSFSWSSRASSMSAFHGLRYRSSTADGSGIVGGKRTSAGSRHSGPRGVDVRMVLEKHLEMLKHVAVMNREQSDECSSLNDLYGGPDDGVVETEEKMLEEKLDEMAFTTPSVFQRVDGPILEMDAIDLGKRASQTATMTQTETLVEEKELEMNRQDSEKNDSNNSNELMDWKRVESDVKRGEKGGGGRRKSVDRKVRMKAIREPKHRRIISTRQGYRLAEKWDCVYIEASTVNNINTVECIHECIRERFVHDTFSIVRPRSHGVV